MPYLFLFIGISLLFIGGEALVFGSVRIAKVTGLSKLLIGVIVMGFGTSAPELVVSIEAALDDLPEIALGNVVGSNLSNTLLILGLAALFKPIVCRSHQLKLDALMVVLASFILCSLSIFGMISRPIGMGLFLLLCAYLVFSVWQEKAREPMQDPAKNKQLKSSVLIIGLCSAVVGLALLVYGAHLLIQSAVLIAGQLGISDAVVGLTLVAIGTSLPELFTVIVAAYRNHNDMVIGNLLGSNLFNILSIVGITAIVKPIPFSGQIATQDVWLMLLSALILLFLVWKNKEISSMVGGIFITLYTAYLIFLYGQILTV